MLCFFFLSLLVQIATAHDVYMMVFPNTLRPGMQFDCVLIRESNFPRLKLNASITVYRKPLVVSKVLDIDEKYHAFSLQIPYNLTSQSYRLEVKATDKQGTSKISRTYYLMFGYKRISLYIQTDKAIYKPGQSVQFRVFAVNSELGVLHKKMNIDIFDPSRNRIAQWRNVSAESGVFQGEMVMSTEPPLGDWSIEVLFGGEDKMTKRFVVEEYVLPKFDVSLSTQGYGVLTDEFLTGTVSAKYTFGKGVKGFGTLTIYGKYSSSSKRYTLKFEIDGSYQFRIKRYELFSVLNLGKIELLAMIVNVTETLTGNSMVDSTEIQYYTRNEKLRVDGPLYFKPGLRYKVYVLLTDQKDRPLPIGNPTIEVSARFSAPSNENLDGRAVNKTVKIGRNGIGAFTLKVPRIAQLIKIRAQFGKIDATKRVYRFQSPSNTFIQVTVLSKTIKPGKEASFLIKSTKAKTWISYMIVSKSGISQPGQRFMHLKKEVVTIPITLGMVPTARFVVYYIKRNAEVVADSVRFSVEGLFSNKVNINFNKARTKPGRDVSLVVKADPGSQCNVLAVDKSILLLKKGNDITSDMVEDEMSKYDTSRQPTCSSLCVEKLFPSPLRAQDVYTIFREAGLNVMTNAILHRYYGSSRGMTSSSSTSNASGYSSSMPGTTSGTSRSVLYESAASASTSEQQVDSGPRPEAPPPTVRSKFPDTWIYSNTAVANSRGKCYITATVPDTITSWVATAFAVHNASGLGVAPNPANLDVYLKFFARLELPYSVTRGEQLILKASVFNYFTTDLEVDVVLKKSACYKNILVSQSENGSSILSYSQEDIFRKITISANYAVTLKFPIEPIELGDCEINLQAISSRASDAVKRPLLVKAEGVEENFNIPILIDATEGFNMNQTIELPENIVPDSVKIRLAVVGDLMGPSLNGIADLLRMPYGCGEQNMMSLVPNIFAIQYLEATNNLKPADLEKGKAYMVSGYQRELRYQHSDASYSAYGNYDRSGSTWLTAFVVKSFGQASPYIYIDTTLMTKSIRWLLGQYDQWSGFFREPGRVWSSWLKGGSDAGPRSLSSFTLIALLEANNTGFVSASDQSRFDIVVKNATEALETSVDEMDNIYELAISSYALALSGSKEVNAVLSKLDTKASEKDGTKYWEVIKDTTAGRYSSSRSRNIEATAYVLLTYVLQDDLVNSIAVMQWLVKQRNAYGGFSSTQDTVVGLQALADIAAVIYTPNFNLKIDVTAQPSESYYVFDVNLENALLFQTLYVPPSTSLVEIQGTGKGVALLQISATYNIMEDPAEPLFSLVVSFTDETVDGFMLRACFSWLGEGVSGMAVMEMGILSGFSADRFTVTSLGILKRTDVGETMITLYFDEISSKTECFEVQMEREGLVAGSQPAIVKLYDYYDPGNHVISLYQPDLLRNTDVCDIGGEDIGCSGYVISK